MTSDKERMNRDPLDVRRTFMIGIEQVFAGGDLMRVQAAMSRRVREGDTASFRGLAEVDSWGNDGVPPYAWN